MMEILNFSEINVITLLLIIIYQLIIIVFSFYRTKDKTTSL